MADFRVPPPHTPIPPGSNRFESSTQHQKSERLEEFELTRIKIEQFVIMASFANKNDPQTYGNVFIQIADLKELMHSGILNADQENTLIAELEKLDFELNNGTMKVKDIYKRIFQFNSHLEDIFPKVKVFNIVQSLKNNLVFSPLDDLAPMSIDEFKVFEKQILKFIKNDKDIEKFDFHINQLFEKLEQIHKAFLHHPRRNHADTINQIMHVADDVSKSAT